MSPVQGSGIRLLKALPIFIVVGFLFGRAEIAGSDAGSIEHRIRAIRAEAKLIDAANDASDNAERRHISVNLPHWQFSGLFNNSSPIFLSAILTEGQLVREESYYLHQDKPLLVKVKKWWDVDEESKAPEPAINQEFYIEDAETIRRVVTIESSPRTRRTIDSVEPARGLGERSRLISNILLGSSHDPSLTEALRPFSEAELPWK